VDEVIVLFKGNIPKKHKHLGIKIYRLCCMTGYATYNVRPFLVKDRQNATHMITATCVTVRSLTRRVEGIGNKISTNSFFSSPDLFDELKTRCVSC
jgi:hypothetical protein